MTDQEREQLDHLWLRNFETRMLEAIGDEWPVVVVEEWEHNGIGERRYVDTRQYYPYYPSATESDAVDAFVRAELPGLLGEALLAEWKEHRVFSGDVEFAEAAVTMAATIGALRSEARLRREGAR